MRKEPMVLQPQAGFGTAQEEVDRIYDYMQPMITCNENHYVGTKGNNGAYQDGAYAVCLEVCLRFTCLRFQHDFRILLEDSSIISYLGRIVAEKGRFLSGIFIRNRL